MIRIMTSLIRRLYNFAFLLKHQSDKVVLKFNRCEGVVVRSFKNFAFLIKHQSDEVVLKFKMKFKSGESFIWTWSRQSSKLKLMFKWCEGIVFKSGESWAAQTEKRCSCWYYADSRIHPFFFWHSSTSLLIIIHLIALVGKRFLGLNNDWSEI